MRQAILLLLMLAAPCAFAQERTQLPDGTPATQSIGAPPKRTEVETAAPIPTDPPPPPGLDESREGETIGLEDAGETPTEKVIPTEREPEPTIRTEPIKSDEPLPPKVTTPDEAAPAVTIRRTEDMTVEEYRRDGRVYMVVFTPTTGVRYTYMDTDGDGRLEGDPRRGTVQPVYYTIYAWD